MLIEVVKGNSLGDVDKFTGVLNRLAGSEAVSMISVRLPYMYKYNLVSSSLSGNIYILNRQGIP
jgi:hypothetical protein